MVYLDHAAATPVSKKVFEAMRPYFSDDFFNPSSAYLPAKKVASDYEAAKNTIARAIGAKGSDLIITAGATEANNLALSGVLSEPVFLGPLRAARPSLRPFEKRVSATPSRVLYLVTEHESIRRVAEKFNGTTVKVLPNGLVDMVDLKAKITDETELISISLANNELGVIQPLAEIGAMIREIKIDRLRRGVKKPLLLHSDASQALNLLDINVARLGVDLLTLNAAKVYGPKGVGALYVSHEVRLSPLTVGGGQENGLRSGTENVAGVIGFAKAVSEAKEHLNGNRKKYSELKKVFLENLGTYELINKKHSLDNFVVLCYNGLDAERLVFLLEEKEVYVATGAACAASKGVRSHVLAAIGLSDPEINGSLRITFGETNTKEQIIKAAQIINQVVAGEKERMRNG
ncbi:cysteine desulfurase [Candidatus Saccharibacteria bacterium]|nr:cysteine desulfurase [Candidatus Saccharibacteria bacterium]